MDQRQDTRRHCDSMAGKIHTRRAKAIVASYDGAFYLGTDEPTGNFASDVYQVQDEDEIYIEHGEYVAIKIVRNEKVYGVVEVPWHNIERIIYDFPTIEDDDEE